MYILLIILSLNFFIALNSGIAKNAENITGTIYGYVFNASRNNASSQNAKFFKSKNGIAGQEVVLYSYVDGQSVEGTRPHTVTDEAGRFEFKGLEVGERFGYYPVTVFKDIEYFGEIVTLTPDTLRKRSDVLVYEPTQSDSAISALTHHIIIKPGIGKLSVREVYFFANRGKYTYVGNVPAGAPNKKIVLWIDVPDKATEMQYGGDLMSCCAVIKDHHIFDTMEFKPGMRQVVVNYLLPYKGKTASLIKEITHTTYEVDIFLPEGTGTLTAPNFTAQPPFEIRGHTYQRYRAENLVKGRRVMLAITGLPATAPDLRWLAPVVLMGLVISIYGVHRWRKSNRLTNEPPEGTSEDESNDKERLRLLNEILQLDEAFEAGTIDETTYYTSREQLKQLVLELDSEMGKLAK